MKPDELKIRLHSFLCDMVDTYFGNYTVSEKMINYTLKVIVKTNIGKLDGVLQLFTNKDGEIDVPTLINDYKNQLGEEKIIFNLQDYIDNTFIKNLIPNKSLVISSKDFEKILL